MLGDAYESMVAAAKESVGLMAEAQLRLEGAIDGETCSLLLLRLRDTACALAVARRDLESVVKGVATDHGQGGPR